MKTRKHKTPRQIAIAECDNLWRQAIRLRDKGLCQCHLRKQGIETSGKDPHHIFSRSHFSTRWLLENGIFLCKACHALSRWSAHKSPEWFREFLLGKWFKTKKSYEVLYISSQMTATNLDFNAIKLYLLEEIQKLKG